MYKSDPHWHFFDLMFTQANLGSHSWYRTSHRQGKTYYLGRCRLRQTNLQYILLQ
jgi:hypothetical protein